MADFTAEDDELLAELGVEIETPKASKHTPREERIIAGFEEIQRFVEEHRHSPRHGENRDIFERLYAVRLDRLRELEDCRALLEPLDHQGLLSGEAGATGDPVDLDDAALLEQLGVNTGSTGITELKHVRSSAEKRAAEEIANREKCEDFDRFKPLFEKVQKALDAGVRTTRKFGRDAGFQKAEIKPGQFFVLGGQVAYVARVGEPIKAPNGDTDARLRVIFSNGTESNLLLRSLQRALYKDEASRWVSEASAGPLFGDEANEEDQESGTIYVLRSKSDHPEIERNRKVLHKIGVTGGKVEQRIANARLDPTFLMADVEIISTYKLYNINRSKLENLIHRVFGPARLEIEIKDRFGNPVVPREWFLVPLPVIDEAVDRITDGTISKYVYDPQTASLSVATR